MTAKQAHQPEEADRQIVITRVFDAPRELVWKVWTQPEHVARWWGPRGFTTTVTEMDLRPGGKWRYVMHGPDGNDYPVHGVFREVVPMERIVTTDEFDDNWQPPQPVDLPKGIVATAVFESAGYRTKLTLTITHPTVEDRKKHEAMGVVGGWNSSLDCMDDHLASIAGVAELRALVADQLDAIASKDLDRLMKHYAADTVTFDAKPPFRMDSAASLMKSWADCFPYFPDRLKYELRDFHVAAGRGEGFAHGLFRFVTEDPSDPMGQTWMRLTACYRKAGAAWKIVHEHFSVPFDPMTGKAVLTLDG